MATKRLAYVDVPAADMAALLGLPEGSEVVGVGWEYGVDGEPGVLLVQVRSDAVPVRTEDDPEDPDADHMAEHVVVKRGAGGDFEAFEKVEDE